MVTRIVHGLIAGLFAGFLGYIYYEVYITKLGVDFYPLINAVNIFLASAVGSVLASMGFIPFKKLVKKNTMASFLATFLILSFISLYGTFYSPIPDAMDAPELFPGLSAPLHFFPMLAWVTVYPFFRDETVS